MPDKVEREIFVFNSPIQFSVPSGKKFIKEVIYEGEFVHPQHPEKKFKVTKERMTEWVDNFKKKLIDLVTVPIDDNHQNLAETNTGFIEDLYIDKSLTHPGKLSLYAKFNILLDDIAAKIGKTILGNSVGIEHYISPETGKDMGEILSHILLTNTPYIEHLGEFQVAFEKEAKKINYFQVETEKKGGSMTPEEMEKKVAGLEKANKEKDAQIMLERKAKEDKEAELIKEVKTNFEKEVKMRIEKLQAENKILPADKDAKIALALKMSRELATEYLNDLEKGAKVIETNQKSEGNAGGQKTTTTEKPKLSELAEIYSAWFMKPSLKIGEKEETDKKLESWFKRYIDAGAGVNFVRDRDTVVMGNGAVHFARGGE